MDDDLTYGRHLRLDLVLSAQAPVSSSHDELLFIIQHQTSELWFRLILAEIDAARQRLAAGDMRGSGRALGRVATVLEHLGASWNVLRTLGPGEFLAFRNALGSASGFQSWQYRLVEFALGNRVLSMMDPHRGAPETMAQFQAELAQPSLYQAALSVLANGTGVAFPEAVFARDRPYAPSDAVMEAWAGVYRDPERFHDLFDLGERLVEVEDRLRVWRFNHVTTVERVIGARSGTGGTSGVSYLRAMLDLEHFPELWHLRSGL